MKKLLVLGIATFAVAVGAFAQGTIVLNSTLANNGVADLTAGNYYSGPYTLVLYENNTATLPAGINGLASLAEIAAFQGAGWNDETTFAGATMSSGTIALGQYTMPDATPSGTVILGLAVYNAATVAGATHAGAIAFPQATASLTAKPPGTPTDLSTGWNSVGTDLVMTPIPEPGLFALAGVGAAALLIFRRRK